MIAKVKVDIEHALIIDDIASSVWCLLRKACSVKWMSWEVIERTMVHETALQSCPTLNWKACWKAVSSAVVWDGSLAGSRTMLLPWTC